ncbi:3-deoxy-manno-octulosonate cytidylyltransferase [Prochlorococcus marinus]|uniref:3-deoxy-manno-octulosonate cytidylyltransferase n=1 Tax=Prochlorococcus marinus TaxID=1219 RepID=UPI0022B482D8|nr:3-deoxy-manno-octulosonate cytidylyltransferase [Prochlorococcus marinus]
MRSCVIIPARYKSSRLPGKPLIDLLGKPMIIWVAEIASRAVGVSNVFIATDDDRIANAVNQKGYKYIMTSSSSLTGTDRVAEASLGLNYDIFVNVQGDEPLVSPKDILRCIDRKIKYKGHIINSYNLIYEDQDPSSINIPKVVINNAEDLIYISRSLVPGFKDIKYKINSYFKQICIYGYNKKELLNFLRFGGKSEIEKSEDIEILRFFELGHPVKMFKAHNNSLSVDVVEDIEKVERELRLRN